MHSEASVELPVKALDTLLQEQGDQTIDLIKMDIEGSEYVVLVDMVKKSIFPKQICVEFHHGMFGYRRAQTIEAVKLLQDAGYEIFYVSSVGREYGFCREDVSAS